MSAIKIVLKKIWCGKLRLSILPALFLLAIWACQLTQNPKVQDTASFDQLYDSLVRFDSVVIVFNTPQGVLLDTVFKGKVDSHSKIRNLPVKGWDGGKAQIMISGFTEGQLVYQVNKKYDGTSDQTDGNIVLITPDAAISSNIHELLMVPGDSLKYPPVTVSPAALSDKSVAWSSSNTDVLVAGSDFIKALRPGNAILKAQLKLSPATQLTINVSVQSSNLAPESLAFEHDTLYLAAGGSSGTLAVKASPSTANNAVTWSVEAASIAKVDSNGNVSGLSKGTTKLIATSKSKPSLSISAVIVVSDPVAVEGPAVAIISPANNSYTNQTAITVKWTVGGLLQDTLPKEILKLGANTITRTAKDSSDRQGSASIVVYLDTLKPLPPTLTGPASTSLSLVWHWSTGGGGGSGDFRFKLGDADFSQGATQGRDTSYTVSAGLISGTSYTLFVEERDLAGNWSDAAKMAIKYDLAKPIVILTAPSYNGGTLYVNASSLNLSGTVSGPYSISSLVYTVGGGTATPLPISADAWSLTGILVSEGVTANVTITATDSVGNKGSLVVPILMDNSPPAAPTIIIAPITPTRAISGTWTWTAGTDGANGSGLNGHFRYALNSGAWKDTTGLGMSSMVLSEGNNVLALQEQDRSGLWSTSATSLVKVDLTAPSLSIQSHSNPATITATHIAFTVSANDSGSGVQSVTVSGQTSGSSALVNSNGIWTSADLTLKGGSNSLVVTANDQVGNSKNLTFNVNVNVPAAAVIISDPSTNTITNTDSIDVSYTIDGTPGKKRFGLVEGSNVLTVTSPPSASGSVGRDSVKVIRDATVPKAPTLAINATNTNGVATWTWISNGDNTGGVGVKNPPAFRYSFNNGNTWTTTSSTSATQTAEGVYILVVQEQDKAGNWSASSAVKSIAVDKTPPIVTILTPNNYITNKNTVTINYTEQDSSQATLLKSKSVPLPTDNSSNTVTISSSADAAGNVGSASITVYRRSKVVFVKIASSGSGDGSSWDNAAGGLEGGIAKAGSGYQIWLAAGTYTPSASGFTITKNTEIFGGFSADGGAFNVTQRDSTFPNNTILATSNYNDTILKVNSVNTDPITYVSDFILNGVQISGLGTSTAAYGIVMLNTTNFEIRNCIFQHLNQFAIQVVFSQGLLFNNIFQYSDVTNSIVSASLLTSNSITFQQCIFQHNSFNQGAGSGFYSIVYFVDGGNLTFNSCSLLDTFPASESDRFYQLYSNSPYPDAVVTFKNSIVTGGLGSILHLGTLNYTGLGNTPP